MKNILWLSLIIVVLGVGAIAEAQQPGKMPRIGFLISSSVSAQKARLEAFRQGLRERGYIEGQNITIEYRSAEGKANQLPALAEELVRLKVDLIVTSSSPGITAVKRASNTMPIVFAAIGPDPVEAGFVSSLARPGGNITGVTIFALELDRKRLELLKETLPRATRVGFLRGAGKLGEAAFREAEVGAMALGLHLLSLAVKGVDDFESVFDRAKAGSTQALTATPTPLFTTHRKRIVDLAAKNRLPGFFADREFVGAGGLMSYGPDIVENYRRAAAYVDKILKGAKPADLPVEQPMKFELVINLKIAKQIGLTIPPNVLAQADKVIR